MNCRNLLVVAIALLLTGWVPLEAAIIGVRPGGSIQDAVNAASSGDVIIVAPGVYPEQVIVSSKDLTLIGLGATLRPSSLARSGTRGDGVRPIRAIVSVTQATVNLGGFTLDGSVAGTGAGSGLTGVFYRNASGVLAACSIVHIVDAEHPGRRDPTAILGESADLIVLGSSVGNFGKNGMTFLNACSVLIVGNSLIGRGEMSAAEGDVPQVGVELGPETVGSVMQNTVSNIRYVTDTEGPPRASAGILLLGASGVLVGNNTIRNCTAAVYDEKSASTATYRNRVLNSDWGIVAHRCIEARIQGNLLQQCYYGMWVGGGTATLQGNAFGGCEVGMTAVGEAHDIQGNRFVDGEVGISYYGDESLIDGNAFELVEHPVLVSPRTTESGPGGSGAVGDAPSDTETPSSLDQYLTDMLTDVFARSYLAGGYPALGDPGVSWRDPNVGGGSGTNGGAQRGADEIPDDYTTTNVQESGVDEPDLTKTDGEYIYVVEGSVLYIIDSWPAEEADLVATITLEGWGETIFLVEDTVVAFSPLSEEDNGYEPYDGGTGENREPFSGVRVTVIDVSDRTSPEISRTIDIEGYMVNARLVDGIVYLATMNDPSYYDPELYDALEALDLPDPWELTYESRQASLPAILNMVTPIVADWVATKGRAAIIPDIRVNGGERVDGFAAESIQWPGHRSDVGMLSVFALDPGSDEAPTGVGLLARGWHAYGSQGALHIAQDSRWWWWPDPETKHTETNIHQFALNEGDPLYLASGAVPGWVLNQFSMSEHNGYLRVATTDQTMGGWWWDRPGTDSRSTATTEQTPGEDPSVPPDPGVDENASNVFVLQQNGTELEIVGEVRGMAPGEQIFAVRFAGDRGYVVTFLDQDPLFTMDLSDPYDPQLRGELHISGFSTYLHPFGEDYLLGVGREGDDMGRWEALQLQMFDVADLASPIRTHQEVISTGEGGWSASPAEHKHHAFTFWSTENLLAIPVTLEDWSYETDEYDYFSGIIVYGVSAEDGFVEVGRVSHTNLQLDPDCSTGEDPTLPPCPPEHRPLRRAVFIRGYLFAFSDEAVTVSTIDDLGHPLVAIPLDSR